MTGNSDSIEQVKERIGNLLEKIRGYTRTDLKMAKQLSEEVIRLAQEYGLKHRQASGLVWYSHAVTTLVGSPDAIDTAREAVELLGDSTDMISVTRAHTVLGNSLIVNSFIAEALEEYQITMELYKEIEDYTGVSAMLNNIAIAYNYMGLYEDAFSTYSEAIAVADDADNPSNNAAAFNNLVHYTA